MNKQDTYPYFLFTTNVLTNIKDQFFRQKQQAIALTEQLIQNKDSSYISKIVSCFLIEDRYLPQLDENSKRFMWLQHLDADMRRLAIICQILMEEKEQPGAKLFFLEQVDTFDDLMRKYIRIKFFLHRLEFSLPETALQEATAMFMEEQVSMCALFQIMKCEVFADKENKYNEILKMKMAGEILK